MFFDRDLILCDIYYWLYACNHEYHDRFLKELSFLFDN